MSIEFTYELVSESGITILEIQKLVNEAWSDLFIDGTTSHQNALNANIEILNLPQSIDGVLTLRPSGAGFDPASVFLIVAGAMGPALSKVSEDVWKYVLLPRIRAKWGDNSLKAKKVPRKLD